MCNLPLTIASLVLLALFHLVTALLVRPKKRTSPLFLDCHETIDYLEEVKDLATSTETETEYSTPLPAETATQIAQHIDKLISTLENTKYYTDEEYR